MMRARLSQIVKHPMFEKIIVALIVINAVILALETVPSVMAIAGPLLALLDSLILAVFVAEIAARLIVDFKGFWRDPWRLFDFAIVAVALIPATGALSALRAFRILRVLRLVSAMPSMRRVVAGLMQALPGMGSIVMLLSLVFFVFAVISTKLFAEAFPEWFGTLGASAYSLFQIMTLESWSMGIVRPVMVEFPYAWALFVPFIVLTTFAVLNLFIGVIVDAMGSEQSAVAHDERSAMAAETSEILAELRALKADIAKMRSQMSRD